MNKILLVIPAIAVIAVAAYIILSPGGKTPGGPPPGAVAEDDMDLKPKDLCVSLCLESSKNRVNLSEGPCLSNSISAKFSDWVCDVAHDPRLETDNLAANQCSEYGKTAGHFVEVTPECEFIRQV